MGETIQRKAGQMGERLTLSSGNRKILAMEAGVPLAGAKEVKPAAAATNKLKERMSKMDLNLPGGGRGGKDGMMKKASGAKGELDVSLKSFESLTADEKKVVESLLEQGKDIKLIPEAPNVSKTPDLLVNGIETEIKTLNGNNIGTLVKRVGKALQQVDETGEIIYDISKANFTTEQMNEITARLTGKYGKDIVDRIMFIK